ncbi:MAG: cytochrome c3 family protein [Candidatus Schekmanbacteria bacterium]|nr:cytochrome c3 family protein [Candidatus Schekmanbacteria bacterium]
MKHLLILCALIVAVFCSAAFAEVIDAEFSSKVWDIISALPGKDSADHEKFVDIDPKRVVFPHTKHQTIVSELGRDCSFCHHDQKNGKAPVACRNCHAKRQVESKGKYARVGQKLNMKHIYHFFCGECHKNLIKRGNKGLNTSPAHIPSKCHHCHMQKGGDLANFEF